MFEIMPIFILAIWAVVIVAIIAGVIKGNKAKKKRDEVYSKVKLEKAADIQNYINMLTNNSELEKKRQACKNSKWYMGLVILIVAGICLFFQFFHPFVLIFTIIICAIISSVATASYSKIYKEQVIASILKNFDKDLQYMPNNGIRKDVYRIARFESFDRYSTEDLITGKICGLDFALADVHTEDESRDSEGHTTYTTIFRGPVAVVELNKLEDLVIQISDNHLKIFRGNQYVELDNQAFEDKYDVFTNNDVIAMRILTPTLTTKILELHDTFGFFYEIKLIDGMVFFRFHSDTLFDPSPNDIEKEATDIAFYFNMLDGMKNIMEEIIRTLNEFER